MPASSEWSRFGTIWVFSGYTIPLVPASGVARIGSVPTLADGEVYGIQDSSGLGPPWEIIMGVDSAAYCTADAWLPCTFQLPGIMGEVAYMLVDASKGLRRIAVYDGSGTWWYPPPVYVKNCSCQVWVSSAAFPDSFSFEPALGILSQLAGTYYWEVTTTSFGHLGGTNATWNVSVPFSTAYIDCQLPDYGYDSGLTLATWSQPHVIYIIWETGDPVHPKAKCILQW